MPCEPIRDKKQIQDMKAVLQAGQNGFRNRLFFEVLLATALRVTDVCQLKKNDIDNGFVRLTTGKTGEFRLIQLNPKVLQMLMMYLETKKEDDFIFDFNRGNAWYIIKGAADKCGIKNISVHSTRKTAAWHFYYENGKDIFKTMQLLGHKDSKETRRYLQLNDDDVNASLAAMYL